MLFGHNPELNPEFAPIACQKRSRTWQHARSLKFAFDISPWSKVGHAKIQRLATLPQSQAIPEGDRPPRAPARYVSGCFRLVSSAAPRYRRNVMGPLSRELGSPMLRCVWPVAEIDPFAQSRGWADEALRREGQLSGRIAKANSRPSAGRSRPAAYRQAITSLQSCPADNAVRVCAPRGHQKWPTPMTFFRPANFDPVHRPQRPIQVPRHA